MMKKSTKYSIKKGKVVVNKPAKPKAKLTEYERYLNIARDNKVPKSEILTKEEYNTVVISNKQRKRGTDPNSIVRQQLQDGLSDKQYRARLNAARHMDPTMSRKKFTETKGWEVIDNMASELYAELKATSSLSTTEISHIISTEIYGSP